MSLDISRSDLEEDVIGALRSSVDIEFEWVSSVAGVCELHGTYSSNPPRIRVARGAGTARANFTAAHEIGHHLQSHDAQWALGTLATLRRADPFTAQDVEERVSNQVAVRLLMPDFLVRAAWTGEISPAFVGRLTRDGRVSRWAASIRASGHAQAEGAEPFVVIIARPDGVVTSAVASDNATFAPPAHWTVQPDLAELVNGAVGRRRSVNGILYASGASRNDVTYDWGWDHNGTHVIVVARPEYRYGDANWGGDEVECLSINCGSSFSRSAADLCPTCVKPVCPDCGYCGCEKAEGAFCAKCFTLMSIQESRRGSEHDVCPF
ncbi:ImmA/IrrE family metallo-endopeptidase [Microbacterium sp. P04]|uniref:ImmA/IrrE family metallo-endopeptidase n=1 Tax=Microbacterium sp. P04 TaxID=3366947 RepID=UPI003745F0CB